MSDNFENLILERVRPMDQTMQDVRGDLSDIKIRMTAVKEGLNSVQTSVVGLDCGWIASTSGCRGSSVVSTSRMPADG